MTFLNIFMAEAMAKSHGIRGEVKSQALQIMEDLLGAGFHLIQAFLMWLFCDSAKGERCSLIASLTRGNAACYG